MTVILIRYVENLTWDALYRFLKVNSSNAIYVYLYIYCNNIYIDNASYVTHRFFEEGQLYVRAIEFP